MKSTVITSTGLTHGMCITQITLAPHEQTEAHFHRQTTEVYTVLLGTGLLKCNQTQTHIESGNCFVIEPNTIHQLINTGDVDLVVISSKDKPRQSNDYFPVANF